MKKIDLYTDGACSGNPGVGGYGYILIYGDYIKEFNGFDAETTNNRMEITAVIEGLKKLKEPCEVNIFTDSAYTMNAFSEGWFDAWKENDWKTANRKQVKNQDLWKELYALMQKHNIHWNKVKGHADNKYNNRCDELARKAIEDYIKNSGEKEKAQN